MARRHKKLSPSDRGSEGPSRKMAISARITRRATTAGQYTTPYAFEACIRLRDGGECGFGKNPRVALANAMIAVSKRLKKRHGSFKGSR